MADAGGEAVAAQLVPVSASTASVQASLANDAVMEAAPAFAATHELVFVAEVRCLLPTWPQLLWHVLKSFKLEAKQVAAGVGWQCCGRQAEIISSAVCVWGNYRCRR